MKTIADPGRLLTGARLAARPIRADPLTRTIAFAPAP